jgi:hypothetical protein
VLSLERASGRQALLVNLVAPGTDLRGRIEGDNAWIYEFAARREATYDFYFWEVDGTGVVQFKGPSPPASLRFEFSDVAPVITVDSDAAVQLARTYGAEPYLQAHPDARPRAVAAKFVGGLPAWSVTFYVNPTTCQLGPIYIDARTGALLARDLWCLSLGR